MTSTSREINDIFFPFNFAEGHFRSANESTTWYGRTVHVIVGIAELLFPVSLIIALFDKVVTDLFCVAPQELPPSPPPSPRPPSQNLSVLDYCKNVLGIQTTAQFSQQLSCSRDIFPARGLQSQQDLQTLGLFLLSSPLDQLEAALVNYRATFERVSSEEFREQAQAEIVPDGLSAILNGVDIADLETQNQNVSQAQNWRVPSGAVRSAILDILNGEEDEENRVEGLKEKVAAKGASWAPFAERIEAIISSLKVAKRDQSEPIQALANLIADLKAAHLKDQIESSKQNAIAPDLDALNNAVEHVKLVIREMILPLKSVGGKFSTTIETQERWNAFLDFGGNEHIEQFIADLRALDLDRQFRWFKEYIHQQDIVLFWNSVPLESRTLHQRQNTNPLEMPMLFQLGLLAPPIEPRVEEEPLIDTSGDAALARRLQSGDGDVPSDQARRQPLLEEDPDLEGILRSLEDFEGL